MEDVRDAQGQTQDNAQYSKPVKPSVCCMRRFSLTVSSGHCARREMHTIDHK